MEQVVFDQEIVESVIYDLIMNTYVINSNGRRQDEGKRAALPLLAGRREAY
jgi:hypothetical protein